MSCYKQLILKKIVRNASRHFQMSLVASLIAQAINHLQVLAVIFYAGFASRQGFQQGFFSLVSVILSVSGHFELFDPFQKMSTGVVILVICFGYILCQYIFISYVLFKLAHHDEVKTRTSKIFFVGLILHTKVLFFPIQFFFVKLLSSFFSCDYNDSELIGCQDWAFTLAILGFILNLALAFLREVYLHQIQRDEKNFFAAKSNSFKIITLLQKSISLPLIYICEDSRSTILALNLLACLIQAFILQTKLPLYDLAMLKLTISMNLIAICLAPISFIRLYYQNEHILSLLLVIMIPLVLRISFIFLNRLLRAIAEFKVNSPEHAAHIPVLIEKYTDQHAVLLTHLSRYQEGAFYFYGLISKEGINIESLKDAEFVSNLKRQLYLATIEHCTQLWQRYPNNELLVLTMAHVYLENLRDAPQAMKLLRKFGKRNLSRAGQSAIEAIYAELENLLAQNSKTDSKPEYLTYLKYQEVGSALRGEIYNEIGEHIKFWDELSQESISDTSLALIAEKISVSHKKIKQLWQSNFTHFGASFSSIYLLYGVYLDSIRGAPHLGLSLIKKGRDFLMHKRALRDVSTDIITDNNAVIVASIEPEKMGEITDASTSVGHIFNIQREKLIGMKINCVLPKIVADKHDIFIQRYYNCFRYNLDKKITSYARTLDGNYFPVESTLRLYPSIQNGLSVLSYIKKCSNTLPLMILNQNGKIIECSKDLQKLLLINTDKEAPNINRICPDLIKFNQAFNLVYLNRTDSMSDNHVVKPSIFCEKGISDTRSGHFLSSREDSVDPLNPTRVETMDFLVSPKERASPKKTSLIPFNKEVAQTMCANLKEGKRLRYYPVGVNILTYQENIEFVTQLEPYEVDGEFFKILRLRRVKVPSASQISVGASSRRLSKCQSNLKLTSLRGDEAPLRTDENTPSEDPKCILLKPADQEDDSQESSISIDEQVDDEEDGVAGLSKLRRQISKQNPSSITTSTRKTLTIIKQLDDLFSKETSNVEKKMSWQVIYSTVIILSVLLCVSLVFTQDSLREMERDVVLLDAVDTRLYNSAIAWYYLLIIYLRPAGIRTSGITDALYQSKLLSASQDMLTSNQVLSTLVDELEDKDTVSVFYQKDITFWQPFNGQAFAPDKLNSFVASQILYTNMMKVAKYKGSLATIGGLEEPLFAINNTANDYFAKAEEDTTTVEEVVVNTVNKNIKLLDILLVIQCLCLVRVFGEILLFMRTVYMSHKKMLEAIIKIKRSHVAGRAEQVKKIAEYLKNDLELNKLDKIPMQNINAHAKKIADQAKLPEKKFVLKGMILLMIKYASIAWLLMGILCTLCIVSFYDSTSAFNSLDKINQKLIVTHNLGSYITMLLPQYYFLTIFQNNTSYTMHNSPPEDRVLKSLSFLGGANQQLISALNDGDNGLSDPVIQKALMDNVCDFLDATTKRYCVNITNQNSFGLLGINSMYYQGISPLMSSYMMNPTLSNAITVFNALTPFTNFVPIVLRNAYAFLSSYFLAQFHLQTSNKLNETYTYFVLILLLNFISAIIIKIITLKKFKVLDIAPRKIMHLIPYNVILDNRIMIFYLKKGFGQELGNLKNFL